MSTRSIVILGNPRSGTTYLLSLLACHNKVQSVEEPLNDEIEVTGNPFDYIDGVVDDVTRPVIAFKCFPEQLIKRNIRIDDLIHHLRCSTMVIIWRLNLLEMFVSRQIGYTTRVWYSSSPPTEVHRVHVDEAELRQFADQLRSEWLLIGSQWPLGVKPLFVTYEDLAQDGSAVAASILSNVDLDFRNVVFETYMHRQNPAPLKEKITNWDELSQEAKGLTVDVAKILSEAIFNSIPIREDIRCFLPDREPPVPTGGWLYRVAAPYLPRQSSRNVMDALDGRCVSSASYWPNELADMLRAVFARPVAQPCASGFAALVLALQTAGIGEGDEVILATFTMIAVPNAVHFVGAVPIVVDNAAGQYNPGLKEIVDSATDKTRAVIISHTYGVPMEGISELATTCLQRKWTLIEDIAECVGVRERETGKLLGTFGDFACASMYANKVVHAGDGGFVIARDPKHDAKLASLVNHGFTRSFHFVHLQPAINAKINGLGAAVACGVLERLNEMMDHRRLISKHYRTRLSSIPLRLMPECGEGDTPWVFGLECETKSQRNQLRQHLAANGVETRDYFLPIHLQPSSEKMNGAEKRRHLKLPVSENLGSTGFYLPMFTDLTLKDADYICDAVASFFDQCRPIRPAPMKNSLNTVRVKPGDYILEAVEFDRSGRPIRRAYRGHPLLQAVSLKTRLEWHMMTDQWDERYLFINDIKLCQEDANAKELQISETFHSILEYFDAQGDFEVDFRRPWLNENIGDQFSFIPTTTDHETLQFLAWLVEQTKASRVLEIGGWLGRTSGLFGRLVRENAKHRVDHKPIVYVLDCFRWQEWMNHYAPNSGFRNHESFLDNFRENLCSLGEIVQAREWDLDDAVNVAVPDGSQFDVVFIDISEEPEEVEKVWLMSRKYCIPDCTVVVFNGFVPSVITFFTHYHRELRSLSFKPRTTARAFLYVGSENMISTASPDIGVPILKRKVKFLDSPGWDHHHKNAFEAAILKLRDYIHDDNATTAFLPAVEEYICDHEDDATDQPWIGIVHQVPHDKERFYHPDLHRLCTGHRYRSFLAKCRGLFTLTTLQADYLRQHLPVELAIPVCQITYPSILLRCPSVAQIHPDDSPSKSTNSPCWNGERVMKLAFIGSFARNINLFYKAIVPMNVQKLLLAGDEVSKKWADTAPSDVIVSDRLNDSEYENLLGDCVAFLALKFDGAANTLVVECIARGTPILAPRWATACVDYLGEGYPLYYDQPAADTCLDLTTLISRENVNAAMQYLQNMDKTKFGIGYFCQSVEESAVMRNAVPMVEDQLLGPLTTRTEYLFPTFDITVLICSYKRTHHLDELLNRLWNGQGSFGGSMQIVVWNNNEARHGALRAICDPYLAQPTSNRRLELIQSTQNYYCDIRTCAPALMRSDRLLICDDDVLPEDHFAQFFYSASQRYPEDVLCVRGHKFLEHALDLKRVESVWREYEYVRFIDDDKPMQFVHFAHADACLVPKQALREWASVEAPDPTFALIDDYWMSFVLNHQFGRNLRKLCIVNDGKPILNRTHDSDTRGLALHTRPEVIDARVRMYMHHMLRGWPTWPKVESVADLAEERVLELKERKRSPWQEPFVGFNVSSKLTEADADDLVRMGVRNVRIGAVGVRKERDYEFSGFNTRPQKQLADLLKTIDMLAEKEINVVLTMSPRVDLVDAWSQIAKHCCTRGNVTGYDLVNEPSSEADHKHGYWLIEDNEDLEGVDALRATYLQLLAEVDKVDPITPILLEPSFWAHPLALPRLEPILDSIADQSIRSRLLLSFHFYEPKRYTQRRLNSGSYTYPGHVPLRPGKWSPKIKLDQNWLKERFEIASKWASDKSWAKIVVGEIGVVRDVPDAADYLKDALEAAFKLGLSAFVYSFRDAEWEAMDYEKGSGNDGEVENEFMTNLAVAAKRTHSEK